MESIIITLGRHYKIILVIVIVIYFDKRDSKVYAVKTKIIYGKTFHNSKTEA